MSKRTRTELVLAREATYRPICSTTCLNCKWSGWTRERIADLLVCTLATKKPKVVEQDAVCDAWEARP